MNILFRDGAYIPIEKETKFSEIDHNSLIGRYDVIFEEDGTKVIPKISPVLMFTRDISWVGDHVIMFDNENVTLNLGAKIYNHSKISFTNSDFRLNDSELDSIEPYYGIYELYNIDVGSNSISSINIDERTFRAELKNLIKASLHNGNPVCYRTLVFTPDITVPRGNVVVMGVLEKNILLSHIDTLVVNKPAYIPLYQLPYVRSTLKKVDMEHGMEITMLLENYSDNNKEFLIILDLDGLELSDYEGDMEYQGDSLVREIIIPAKSKKQLSGTIIF